MKKIKPGYISRPYYIVWKITRIIVALFIVLTEFVAISQVHDAILVMTIINVLLFLIVTLIFGWTDPIYMKRSKFYEQADVNKYIDWLDKTIDKKNLHEETISYLSILKAEALFLKDFDESKRIIADTIRPSEKSISKQYDLLFFSYCIREGNKDNALKLLEIMKKSYKTKYSELNRIYTARLTTDNIENVEKYFSYKKSMKYFNIINLETLVTYYDVRNDINKRNEYARILLPLVTDYEELKNKLNIMLGE